ncbi:PDZ domain-containing protein [Caenorhabditis elegans]|uniref:PDZ domain-containing protein n=1 Tax=Caenorhabditis elegans TaxID=6239 RepID=O76587_CAEEL|nr:PDZ domain-containing protein [Caenorhabditis elegans]CCD69601.2 PDZ domain-containing protein [Caenorhabditis elegans]|eukprot:NP_494256.3 Uncharacterized protein CELE_F16G10.5 [Caenorhabditis elegans]
MDRQSHILSVGLKKASNGEFGLQVMDGIRGPVISFVSPGSASAHIFRAGDVIMAVNDRQVTDMKTVQDSFEAAGNVVWIEFYRPAGITQLNL